MSRIEYLNLAARYGYFVEKFAACHAFESVKFYRAVAQRCREMAAALVVRRAA